MRVKKIHLLISLSIILSTPIYNVTNTKATNFEGNESKYYELCVANELSKKDKQTCKDFNQYLKDRNEKLEAQLKEAKSKKQEAEDEIENIKKEIAKIDEETDKLNDEILYVETAVNKLENQIYEKEQELGERLYANQSYINSSMFIKFIFGAENISDFFSRQSAVKEITAYEDELIDEIRLAKEDLDSQKSTLEISKLNLEAKQAEQRELQKTYILQLEEQSETIAGAEEQLIANQESMDLINKNINALTKATNESYISGIVNATPNEPIYERDENGNIIDVNNSDVGIAIANKALSRQGYMYVWGGAHNMSAVMDPNWTQFDCSGLVSWAHYQAGVNIGVQYTGSLVYMGKKVEKGNMQPGDIILFSDNGDISGVHHVGIYIGNNQMVHAPCTGKAIQVANLDNAYWQNEWLVARRLF